MINTITHDRNPDPHPDPDTHDHNPEAILSGEDINQIVNLSKKMTLVMFFNVFKTEVVKMIRELNNTLCKIKNIELFVGRN